MVCRYSYSSCVAVVEEYEMSESVWCSLYDDDDLEYEYLKKLLQKRSASHDGV